MSSLPFVSSLLILGLFYMPVLQLVNLNPTLFFHFTFSHHFFFYSAFSLSLFYMELFCINRRSVFYKYFEIMLGTLSSQLHKPTRISRKTLCDPTLLQPFPSLESHFTPQPFSPFLTRAGSSKYLNILCNLTFQCHSHICLHSRRFDMWLKRKT
jgi:hypothetical protein